MKARFLLFGVLLLTLLFSSCGEKSYTAYECERCEGNCQGTHTLDFSPWRESLCTAHRDDTAELSKQITFNGKSYSCTYEYSLVEIPNLYKTHRYTFEEEGREGVIELHAQTGEVTYFYGPIGASSDEALSREALCDIADVLARSYICVGNYERSVQKSGSRYSIRYERQIGEYELADNLSLTLTEDGHVVSFQSVMAGSFDGITDVGINRDAVTVALREKIKAIYGSTDAYETFSYDIVQLIRTEGGIGAVCYTEVEFDDDMPHEECELVFVVVIG